MGNDTVNVNELLKALRGPQDKEEAKEVILHTNELLHRLNILSTLEAICRVLVSSELISKEDLNELVAKCREAV